MMHPIDTNPRVRLAHVETEACRWQEAAESAEWTFRRMFEDAWQDPRGGILAEIRPHLVEALRESYFATTRYKYYAGQALALYEERSAPRVHRLKGELRRRIDAGVGRARRAVEGDAA